MNFDLCSILLRGVYSVRVLCVEQLQACMYLYGGLCTCIYVHVHEKFAECTDRSHLWIPMDRPELIIQLNLAIIPKKILNN